MNAGHVGTIAVAALVAGTIQAFALADWFPPDPGAPGAPPSSHSAPGPVVGAGIPLALLLGGYLWYRNRRNK